MHSIRGKEQFRFNCLPKFNQRSQLCCHRLQNWAQNWPQTCLLYESILAIDFLPLQKVEFFPILFKAGFMLCFGQWCSNKHDKSRTFKSGCISRPVFSCCFSNVATVCVCMCTQAWVTPLEDERQHGEKPYSVTTQAKSFINQHQLTADSWVNGVS